MKNHPRTLPVCFFTELWERYGFLLTQGLLTLLLVKVYGFDDSESYAISGAFIALLYMTSIMAGFIADKILGALNTAIIGGVILCVGYLLLGFGYHIGPSVAYISLAIIAVATGMIKSNTATLLGDAYARDDPSRDYGFSLFFIAINLGAFCGGISSGYLSEISWKFAFSTAAIGALLATLTLYFGMRYYVGYKAYTKLSIKKILQVTVIITLSIVFSVYILSDVYVANMFFIIAAIASVGVILYACYSTGTSFFKGLSLIIYIATAIVWGAIFYQMVLTGPLLAERLTTQMWLGLHIPSATLLAVEALGVMLFGVFTGKVWQHFAKKGKPIHDATKFAIALYIMGLCYALILLGLYLRSPMAMLSLGWLVTSYLFVALSDLSVNPIGLSIANKLAPNGYHAIFIGVWYVGSGLSGKLAGVIADQSAIPKDLHDPVAITEIYIHAYSGFVELALIAAVVMTIFIPVLKRFER